MRNDAITIAYRYRRRAQLDLVPELLTIQNPQVEHELELRTIQNLQWELEVLTFENLLLKLELEVLKNR